MKQVGAPTFQGLRKRWRVAEPPDPADTAALGDLPPLVGRLLHQRGLRTAREVRDFLDVSESLSEDPETLPDIGPAIERLARARQEGETTAVFGDFDADGVTGAVLMVRALTRYGISAVPYIPHRVQEGHGLNQQAVEQLRGEGASLIVTVDCGVTDVEAIATARGLGMDTIVTDHHAVIGPRPDAVAIINPRAPGSTYGFVHLTGVGMALKLAQALLSKIPTKSGEPSHPTEWSQDLMELAAIGTITDMAPLVGENRYIVHRGLEQLRHTGSVGLQALMRVARVRPAEADAGTIGFALGPRLNAAGRVEHAMASYKLLTTGDPAEAGVLAAELDRHNDRRRQLTAEVLQACQEEVVRAGGPGPLVMLGDARFNPGVVGLVAGRLAEEFGVPALVYGVEGDTALGSCRSAAGFHWAEALAVCDDLLLRHGGHAQAAGFSCRLDRLPELRERLEAIAAERWSVGDHPGEASLEAEVELPQLMGPTLPALRKMEPFGMGNPAPVFLTRGATVQDVRTMGANGQHFRLHLHAGGALWEAVAFNQAWQPGTERVDVVYTLETDHWNGTPRLRLNLLDFSPAR